MGPKKKDVAVAEDEAAERGTTPAEVLREKGLLPLVVVRTFGAGVHVGLCARREGMEVDLVDGRRLWRWRGANSLHEVALHGVDDWSRLSEPTSYTLTTAIEVLPVSDRARESLTRSRWPA